MIEKEQYPPDKSPNLNTMELYVSEATHKANLKPSSEAPNCSF